MSIQWSVARILLLSVVLVIFYAVHGQAQGIRETYRTGLAISACDGLRTEYTCPLSGSINSNDVRWYRLITGASTKESIDRNGDDIYFETEVGSRVLFQRTVLTIISTSRAYNGYLWVEVNSQTFCNASITVFTGVSSLNVTTARNIESLSIVVQWDAVDDSLPTSYTVAWTTNGVDLQVVTLLEQTSYTITGLTLDTVYTIAVSGGNLCGQGEEFRTSISFPTVISEPDDVTMCEGREAVFTCVLHGSIRSDNVQWYRSPMDTSSTELINPEGENINILNHTSGGALNASLIITSVSTSFTGDFFVRISSRTVCRASLTILPKPSALARVTVTNNNATLSSVLQWDPVDASPGNNYTVTWTSETDLTQSVATTVETSYTITGLTLDTVYTIAISAVNMCGQGPESSATVSFSAVISEPDDVTVCEGREAVFTCVLNNNIRSDDVQWYRLIKDTSTTVMVDQDEDNINFITDTNGNTTSSSLTITNAIKSFTGYFWVGTPSLNVCNASLTVLTSPSALTVDATRNSEQLSVDVQWDTDDSLITNFTVNLTSDGIDLQTATLINRTSYTITGLTLDTVYAITVTPANLCGQGPEFSTTVSFPTVISEPDDVTKCEGREAVFTCVLNSNIRSDDVQWYRFIKDTSTTEMVDPDGDNINFDTDTIGNATSSSLTITNVIKSYTGYFWVGTPSLNVCNASLTVLASPSNLTVNVTENDENLSVVIQWGAVINLLNTTYMVSWNDGNNSVEADTLTEQTSYTITGLTLDTVYTITVTAANDCGHGPEFRTSVMLSADIPSSSSISSTIASPITTTDLSATTITIVNNSSTIASTTNIDTIATSVIIATSPSFNTVTNIIDYSISAAVSKAFTTTATVIVPSVSLSSIADGSTHPISTSTTSTVIIPVITDIVTTTTTTTPGASTTIPTTSTPLTFIDSSTTITTTAVTATVVSNTVTGAIPPIIATTSQSPASSANDSSSAEAASDDSGIGIEIIAGAAAGGIAILLIILIVICCCIYMKKKGKRKHRIHRHNTFLSDTNEIPGTLSAYGEEKEKPGVGTFHPPEEEDTASIKSDVVNDKNQNSEPLIPPNTYAVVAESSQPPDDTYDKLLTRSSVFSENTYDKLPARSSVFSENTYDKLPTRSSVFSEDTYDKLPTRSSFFSEDTYDKLPTRSSVFSEDTYDKLPKRSSGFSEVDAYDKLRKPSSGYTSLLLTSNTPDIYDNLMTQKVANPPMGTSDSEQYVNLPSRLAMSSNNRTSYDGGQTENNPSVNNTSSDPPDNANNGGVQYLNVTNIMALTNERDDDNNRASDNQHEITYANLQPLPPSTDKYITKNNANLVDYISTAL